MTCNCQKEQYPVYAKTDDAADLVHCIECKFENYHKCNRFTSSVTGLPYPIQCSDARNDLGLCGFNGRYWIKKEG